MRRRELVRLVVGAAAWPLVARAQQAGNMKLVGVLMDMPEADLEGQARLQAFRQGLADHGWVEGRNLRLDVRWAAADAALQQSQTRELAALAPDVVLTRTTLTTQALKRAVPAIPIVFATINDPVATGVVSNLARPEANVTGFMGFEYSMAGKWLELLKNMAPRLTRVGLFFNPGTAGTIAPFYLRAAQEAGERLALKVTAAEVREAGGIETAIMAMAGSDDGGLLVIPDAFNISIRATTIALAAKYRVPAIYYNRLFAAEGGLLSYGADVLDQFRHAAGYVDRILRGAKPSELPVQFPTKFGLVINLKTAKALGLEVPPMMLALTDEVIE